MHTHFTWIGAGHRIALVRGVALWARCSCEGGRRPKITNLGRERRAVNATVRDRPLRGRQLESGRRRGRTPQLAPGAAGEDQPPGVPSTPPASCRTGYGNLASVA